MNESNLFSIQGTQNGVHIVESELLFFPHDVRADR